MSSRSDLESAVLTAMVGSGAVSAQFIAGKATRDALYLAHLDVTTLPVMVMVTAVVSLLLVAACARALRSVAPRMLIPAAFVASSLLQLGAWLLLDTLPRLAAQLVYLQISGLGPMLGSGFWLIATERFDPHSARLHFSRIAGVGTISGLGGALIAERMGATIGIDAMLPLLAAVNLVCAWYVRQLAGPATSTGEARAMEAVPDLAATSPRSGLRVLASAPYLRNLAALVMLGTVASALADYIFKVQAVDTFGRGDGLLRFFALYYALVSLLAFVVQSTLATLSLERLGLGVTTATPSLGLVAGGLGALVFPGLEGTLVARGAESIFRSSLFKTGYEIFFTPISPSDKRAAKSIIDVGFDRVGDAIGGGLIWVLIALPAAVQYSALLGAAIVCSGTAVLVSRRLSRGYIQTLERSLLDRAVELDLGEIGDLTTRTVMMRTLRVPSLRTTQTRTSHLTAPVSLPTNVTDPDMQAILALKSRNRDAVLSVLRHDEGPASPLIPHIIPLLAWDPVSEEAVRALRRVAEEHVGELVDALLDPNQPFAVRRRLARVFSVCVSQRAVDGLLLVLEDQRFEVRFQCGRSLAALVQKNPNVRIDKVRVFDVVRKDVAVSRPVWESHRLLDTVDPNERTFVDEFLKDRAGQSLAHIFTLLSLVLPTEPLRLAYFGLHTDDPNLRGTALEYLEGVLPPDIRERLWPFLSDRSRTRRDSRGREEILADLLRSNESIMLNLEELRRRSERLDSASNPSARKAGSGRGSGVSPPDTAL